MESLFICSYLRRFYFSPGIIISVKKNAEKEVQEVKDEAKQLKKRLDELQVSVWQSLSICRW